MFLVSNRKAAPPPIWPRDRACCILRRRAMPMSITTPRRWTPGIPWDSVLVWQDLSGKHHLELNSWGHRRCGARTKETYPSTETWYCRIHKASKRLNWGGVMTGPQKHLKQEAFGRLGILSRNFLQQKNAKELLCSVWILHIYQSAIYCKITGSSCITKTYLHIVFGTTYLQVIIYERDTLEKNTHKTHAHKTLVFASIEHVDFSDWGYLGHN